MYLNNSIFGEVGVGVGCNMGFLPPVMDFTGMLHPLVVPFLPGGGGGGVLPCMAYMGMCHWTGYGFLKYLKCQQNHSNKPMSVEWVVDLDQYN